MRTKAVAILLLAIFALSSIATVPIIPVSASSGSSNTLTLSDAELMLPEFTKEWGPGILGPKIDVAGPGVQFDFTMLQPGADTGVGDNFAVNALAGGAYKDYGFGFAGPYDFSGYKRYSLCIENVGPNPVTVALFMNTGWTVDWSGGKWIGPDGFGASPARDTFWRSDWVEIGPGVCTVVTLDFSGATVYNAIDDPVLAWRFPNGTPGVTVRRLDEVSNIGFMVLGNGIGNIVVKGTQLYIDPPVVNMTPSDVCTSFTVDVTLSNFANLAGFDIKLTWDGTLITETGVDYTTTLDALWGAGNWNVQVEQSGAGFYRLVAVALATSASNTGASVLFKKTFHVDRSCNFPRQTAIHFALVKLSDNMANPICAVVTDGMYYMSATTPDLEFKVKKHNRKTCQWEYVYPPYEFEYCDWIEVEVWVTHICPCSPLTDYHLKVKYDPHLIGFYKVDEWGIFGPGTVTVAPPVIQVSGEGNPWIGSEGLLFALTFHVEFECIEEHIWKKCHTNYEEFGVEIVDAELSFGSIYTLTLSDAELSTQFAKEVGPATLAAITDVAGPGVQFDFTGLNPVTGTVVGDNFPVSQLAGGAWKTYGVSQQFSTWGDFSAYKRYSLCICNVGPNPVSVALKMNTGWTIPPPEYAAMWRDTYWQSAVVSIGPGECKVVTLDFSASGEAWNIADDLEFPGHTNGEHGTPVWRTDEVSEIGFQVWGNGASSIVLKALPLGIIGMGGIIIPPPMTIRVNFVRGDVNCDGKVTIDDISAAAYYYDEPGPTMYDLNCDGIIDVYDLVIIGTNYGYGVDP